MHSVRRLRYVSFALLMGLFSAFLPLLVTVIHASASFLGIGAAMVMNPEHENIPNVIDNVLGLGIENVVGLFTAFVRGVVAGFVFALIYNFIFVKLLNFKPLKVDVE